MTIYWVTGTDTDCGKTWVASSLLADLKARGRRTVALKPIASGCEQTPEGLRNSDACILQEAATETVPYTVVNPFSFEPAIAPHLAAAQVSSDLTVDRVLSAICLGLSVPADDYVIEGAGGWLVPLNEKETFSDVVEQINAQVICVVGMRLGCLNHASLTLQSIGSTGVTCIGWVANHIDPEMLYLEDNINTLKTVLSVPFLGSFAFRSKTLGGVS